MTERTSRPHPHREYHFRSNDTVRDIVIGLSDGLTVPFALAAGLSGAVSSTRLVVLAGLAEIAAGSIAMGLGGYLAARGDNQHYRGEREREEREILDVPEDEEEEIYGIFAGYGVSREAATPVLRSLQASPKAYVDFMMRFELGLEEPDPHRAWISAATIAFSYIVGGLVPLSPYVLLTHDPSDALRVSVLVTLIALFAFGMLKGKALGAGVVVSGLQTAGIGGIAAGAAFALARFFNGASI